MKSQPHNPENFRESMGQMKWWPDSKSAPNTISTRISWHDPNGLKANSAECKH